jgi:cation transport ATPase
MESSMPQGQSQGGLFADVMKEMDTQQSVYSQQVPVPQQPNAIPQQQQVQQQQQAQQLAMQQAQQQQQQQMAMQQQSQQQQQLQQELMQQQMLQESQNQQDYQLNDEVEPISWTDTIINHIKWPLIVGIIVLLISLPQFNRLLASFIPIGNMNITILSKVVISMIIFYLFFILL